MTDPRIAVLSALSSPGWHPVPEAHGMPWGEAEELLAAYDASRAAAAPSAPADRSALRDRIAAALIARIKQAVVPEQPQPWGGLVGSLLAATEFDLADAVLAVLPEPGDRAAGWRAAADHLETLDPIEAALAGQHAWREAADHLRRMADEAQQPCPGYETTPNRCTCDCEGCKHHCAAHQADEAQQPETQDDAHPPTVTWEIESPRRGTWASWGTTYDEHDWARERFEDAIGHVPARQFRLVRATTVYAVEAEHQPAAVSQPDVARQADTAGEQPAT